jgi:hypothetical protein
VLVMVIERNQEMGLLSSRVILYTEVPLRPMPRVLSSLRLLRPTLIFCLLPPPHVSVTLRVYSRRKERGEMA